jgi:hypothetical protein
MSDDLIKRLRDEHLPMTRNEASDRIEQLNERLTAATGDAKEAEAYAQELEAKLTKAVEALHFYADFYGAPNDGPWGINSDDFGTKARATLAKLEGKE